MSDLEFPDALSSPMSQGEPSDLSMLVPAMFLMALALVRHRCRYHGSESQADSWALARTFSDGTV
jgi:hypothetical protein